MLQQRFTKVQSERDELYERFESSIYEVAQKSGLKVSGAGEAGGEAGMVRETNLCLCFSYLVEARGTEGKCWRGSGEEVAQNGMRASTPQGGA